ncbi:MlaD family protein [Conexibacter sp. SYSU D00693]|uniref:MlaD family protein n=1 Tax=Conexibacter sp. SYSU D00693 TaxID=2812560 RepID=UPI00196A240B|nr:MlaD family protein [Conexibacter sp. SYSU D00693]
MSVLRRRRGRRELGRPTMLLIGVLTTAVAGVLLWIGYDAPNRIPGERYYTLLAQFDDADNVTAHYQVRMGGRNVGQVLDPRVQDGKAVIELQLERGVAPLRSDTTLRIRPRSPVGVRFVELTPGRSGDPLPDGALIPSRQTSSTVTLDTFLGTLDARRRREAHTVLSQLGVAFTDRGADLSDTIGAAPRFLRDTRAALGALNDLPGATRGFVAGAQGAAAAADPVRDDIAQGLRPEARVLDVVAQRRRALQEALEVAPASLAAVRGGLAAADPLVRELGRLGTAAAATLRPAPQAFARTSALLRTARPGLRAAPRALRLAERATAPTLRLLGELDPVVPVAERGLEEPLPLLRELGGRDCDVRRWFAGWRAALGLGVDDGRRIGPATSLRLALLTTLESVGAQGPALTSRLPGVQTDTYPAPCGGGGR